MANYRLAAIIRRSSSENDEFFAVRQNPPPKLPEKEYESYVDSDLWDLPSTTLKPLSSGAASATVIHKAGSCADKVDLEKYDVDLALDQVLSQVSLGRSAVRSWAFWKYVEEPEFGPGPLLNTVFVVGLLRSEVETSQEASKWMSEQTGLSLLLTVKPGDQRVGPLIFTGLLSSSTDSRNWKIPKTLLEQEYPPGVVVIPMTSRTRQPFHTTNLVVIAPIISSDASDNSSFVGFGDALIMDPGCCTQNHAQLLEIVASLPEKLVVFVTHHHYDHVDGLSVVKKINPNAVLVAHENTLNRIGKDDCFLRCVAVSGGEKICIAGQTLEVIFAPGHTDGHMGLLHACTNSLIVGDHCVGQGSAVLDIESGGNMKDYFQTTYKFMEMSPHVLIPMHGRVNLWPKQMLCGYLKHRRDRESSILKAIEGGAQTLFDIIAKSYADTDTRLWLPASSNVRLHVEHLAHQDRLPKDFSLEMFHSSSQELVSKMGEVALSGKPSI